MNREVKYRTLNKYRHSGQAVIKSVSVGKIYHVREGRNAWHSTWVIQYEPNSFFSSLAAAKEYAESLRKSGSVLNVLELPCVIVRSDNKVVFITEVNVDNPLSTHIIENEIDIIDREVLNDYVVRLDFLPDFVKSFMPSSLSWQKKVKEKDMIILEHANKNLKVDKVGEYISYLTSDSIGVSYYLNWTKCKRVVDFSSVNSIVFNLQKIIDIDFSKGGELGKIKLSKDDKIRLLRSKLIEASKGILEAEIQDEFVDKFLQELRDVYTEKTIANASHEKMIKMMKDWTRALGYFSPSDRVRILGEEAIRNGEHLFLEYAWNIKRCPLH
ncbi:hypothetical protein HXW73_16405 [Halomonas sp. SH5A2]|uniref:hypothetical protein n=1 Tax=Halomonas sp. SH5A2 TaxID=2749040 RepID=UPI00163DF068|nr:hypothetical protein [Halomonas sp. SH5A2]QNI04392.1 hypothetical protein HXW73_16405 [Halomonas sp. SH5A2]